MDYASIYGKAEYESKVHYKTEGYREDEIINKPLSCTELVCNEYQTDKDVVIDLSRSKWDTDIQYRWQQKDEVKGFVPKLVAQLEYGTVYQHQGMLLQNLHRHYLYLVIRLPKLKDLEQRILTFPNFKNYGITDHQTQIWLVMTLNLKTMHCINKYVHVSKLTT